MIVGLTLGKFAPLHKGHQYMFETALAEVDHLIIIVYDAPGLDVPPTPVRAGWIRRLYPQAEVLEAYGGPSEEGYAPAIMRAHERFVLDLLDGRSIDRFYSSERYGEHMSKALGCEDRRVDMRRSRVPISATKIREDSYAYREFMDPLVYRDLILNVVILGAESSGKTTLARRLAAEFHTVWMPEFGREYWEKHQVDMRLTPEQMVELAQGHLSREDAALDEANGVLFTDTNALTTRLFAHHYHGHSLPTLDALADACAFRYDLVVVCDIDIPYEDTWDRSGEEHRRAFQRMIVEDLRARKIPFLLVRGSIEDRVRQVRDALAGIKKFGTPQVLNMCTLV